MEGFEKQAAAPRRIPVQRGFSDASNGEPSSLPIRSKRREPPCFERSDEWSPTIALILFLQPGLRSQKLLLRSMSITSTLPLVPPPQAVRNTADASRMTAV